jgi:hypothetical protein
MGRLAWKAKVGRGFDAGLMKRQHFYDSFSEFRFFDWRASEILCKSGQRLSPRKLRLFAIHDFESLKRRGILQKTQIPRDQTEFLTPLVSFI